MDSDERVVAKIEDLSSDVRTSTFGLESEALTTWRGRTVEYWGQSRHFETLMYQ